MAVALIAKKTLQVSSNQRPLEKRPPWRPQHRAGGMMMLGPPDRLLPRGTEAVTANISRCPSCCSTHLRNIPGVCPNSHRSADKK